ncbi:hypothetical protein BD626DRAFT_571380 [Schizophyllum amplum]|uniref:Uncharacterized protein n=1 Tax=Schizophyllum amplum TaxID=97359 RepID=A0A550C873_9AGAR|nr:hypothetical protein BD626DRAFT_571380 [Auriculariopsis ampla]
MSPSTSAIISVFSLGLAALSGVVAQDTLPYNFTLAALNVTEPNANSTGAPLVLATSGALPGLRSYVTATYASAGFTGWSELGLEGGVLNAYYQDELNVANATIIESGSWMAYVTGDVDVSGEQYSVVESEGAEYGKLAVNGDADSWSLCPHSFGQPKMAVMYEATERFCYAVTLQVVPLE